MATLNADFEDDLRAALLDEVERRLEDEIGPQLMSVARGNWQRYAQANGYDISFIHEEATYAVERDGDSVDLRVEWPELTALFEFGVSPHTIQGNPVLHFYYDRIDQWVTTEEVEWGSETGGIPESRAIRDSLLWLRRIL